MCFYIYFVASYLLENVSAVLQERISLQVLLVLLRGALKLQNKTTSCLTVENKLAVALSEWILEYVYVLLA
jgi:hypothetical protein